MTTRIYQYKTACFDRNGDHDQPQQGDWVIQRLDDRGQWRNQVWPFASRELAEQHQRRLA